jgi:hypothetical protein
MIPSILNPEPTRGNREIMNKEMMCKFDKLNEEYNKMAEIRLGNKFMSDDIDKKLNLNEENVFYMIEKAKKDMKMIFKNNDELKKKVSTYETYKKDAVELINGITKLNEFYFNLSRRVEKSDDLMRFDHNLNTKSTIFHDDLKNRIEAFKDNINILIDTNNDEINNNNKKILGFKSLVRECLKDEHDDKDAEKNICSICVTHKIDTCLNPCGHTFCLKCVDKMENSCAMCRNFISTKIKMFIVDNDEEYDDVTSVGGGLLPAFGGFDTVSLFSDYLQ